MKKKKYFRKLKEAIIWECREKIEGRHPGSWDYDCDARSPREAALDFAQECLEDEVTDRFDKCFVVQVRKFDHKDKRIFEVEVEAEIEVHWDAEEAEV